LLCERRNIRTADKDFNAELTAHVNAEILITLCLFTPYSVVKMSNRELESIAFSILCENVQKGT
jgi:hypothetical protein